MIDFQNEIFTTVAKAVRAAYPDVRVTAEYLSTDSVFPSVTLEEIENVTMGHLVDSSRKEKFAGVSYRLHVFSNRQSGKKMEARAIFSVADAALLKMGFHRIIYSTSPELYSSTIYQISAIYRATIGAGGVVYKR